MSRSIALAAGRYGLNVSDIQAVVSGAIGGENVSETVEGLARFPISLRYPREWRDSPERLVQLPISTPMGQQITLGTVASIAITDGPPMLKSENARPSGWVYVDVRGRDLASVAKELRDAVSQSGQAGARRQHRLLRPVRVPGAGQCTPQGGGTRDVADHLRAALPDLLQAR